MENLKVEADKKLVKRPVKLKKIKRREVYRYSIHDSSNGRLVDTIGRYDYLIDWVMDNRSNNSDTCRIGDIPVLIQDIEGLEDQILEYEGEGAAEPYKVVIAELKDLRKRGWTHALVNDKFEIVGSYNDDSEKVDIDEEEYYEVKNAYDDSEEEYYDDIIGADYWEHKK